MEGPIDLRPAHVNCILQDLFRDTPLDHIWRAQICQIWPNMMLKGVWYFDIDDYVQMLTLFSHITSSLFLSSLPGFEHNDCSSWWDLEAGQIPESAGKDNAFGPYSK